MQHSRPPHPTMVAMALLLAYWFWWQYTMELPPILNDEIQSDTDPNKTTRLKSAKRLLASEPLRSKTADTPHGIVSSKNSDFTETSSRKVLDQSLSRLTLELEIWNAANVNTLNQLFY